MTFPAVSSAPSPRVPDVVSTLNEARNLPHVLAHISPDVPELIFVDEYPTDGTITIARLLWPDVHIVRLARAGKGNAVACGHALATGDSIAVTDALGSADLGEIPQFVIALLDGADFAKVTRFVEGRALEEIPNA